MKSLRSIDGCPARGFIVTVYGSNPWNAMLTIRLEAGPPHRSRALVFAGARHRRAAQKRLRRC